MQYELSQLEKSIERVAALLEKHSKNSNAFEILLTMQEVLLAQAYVVSLLQKQPIESNSP